MCRIACLASIALLAGCSPAPVLRLTALEPSAPWQQGSQLVRRDSSGVVVTAAFERTWEGNLVFDLEVTNRSDATVVLDPVAIHYTVVPAEGARSGPAGRAVLALDPEQQLARLDRLVASENANQSTGLLLDMIGGVLEGAAALAARGTATEAEADEDQRRDLEREAARHRDDERHATTLATLADRRAYWARQALRRTDLAPGETAAGKVLLPAGPLGRVTRGPRDRWPARRVARTPAAEQRLQLHVPPVTNPEGIPYRFSRP